MTEVHKGLARRKQAQQYSQHLAGTPNWGELLALLPPAAIEETLLSSI